MKKFMLLLTMLFGVGVVLAENLVELTNGGSYYISETDTRVSCSSSGQGGRLDPEPGINAAADLCNKQRYASDKKACLKIVGSAEYFSKEAVNECDLRYSSQDIECVEAIKNKIIYKFEADSCGSLIYPSQTISCFQDLTRMYR